MIPKFRVWDVHNKKMLTESELVIWNGNVYANDYQKIFKMFMEGARGLVGYSVDDKYLMQSTGLFDKNGKEIFEGDVVKLHHFTECYSEQGGFYEGEEELIGFIKYGYTEDEVKSVGKVYPPRWLLKTSSDEIDFSFLYGIHEESFEVIGNVYQNPELVEVKNE